jgi:hypothetical protein
VLAVILTAGALVGTSAGAASAAADSSSRVTLGVYAGAGPSGVASFAAATDAHMALAGTFLPRFTRPGETWAQAWTPKGLQGLRVWAASPYRMVIAVPMIMQSPSGAYLGTLAAGAAGDYDSYFATLSRTLVADGHAYAYLRLGWEFNGTWYAWSVTSTAAATDFARYWQHIVTTMRAVGGAHFRFVWNPANSQRISWPLFDAYPGNRYVDDIGVDVYDQSWMDTCGLAFNNTATAAESACVWNRDLLAGGWGGEGLTYYAHKAETEAKPLVIPEWAVLTRSDGHGLGDDPNFMADALSWMQDPAHDVAWATYFDTGTCTLTDFPKALAVYRSLAGG